MITAITKEYINGRWVDFDASKIYSINSIITAVNGDTYKIVSVNGSRINFEKIETNTTEPAGDAELYIKD